MKNRSFQRSFNLVVIQVPRLAAETVSAAASASAGSGSLDPGRSRAQSSARTTAFQATHATHPWSADYVPDGSAAVPRSPATSELQFRSPVELCPSSAWYDRSSRWRLGVVGTIHGDQAELLARELSKLDCKITRESPRANGSGRTKEASTRRITRQEGAHIMSSSALPFIECEQILMRASDRIRKRPYAISKSWRRSTASTTIATPAIVLSRAELWCGNPGNEERVGT